MKNIKDIIFWFILFLFVGSLFLLKSYGDYSSVEDNESYAATCDYFNGKVLEVTDEYLYVEPIDDWEWSKASKVKIPLKNVNKYNSSEWKTDDMIRVAFNSSSMEWEENEVFISIVFQIYMISEID